MPDNLANSCFVEHINASLNICLWHGAHFETFSKICLAKIFWRMKLCYQYGCIKWNEVSDVPSLTFSEWFGGIAFRNHPLYIQQSNGMVCIQLRCIDYVNGNKLFIDISLHYFYHQPKCSHLMRGNDIKKRITLYPTAIKSYLISTIIVDIIEIW